jgi:hypothetical protein
MNRPVICHDALLPVGRQIRARLHRDLCADRKDYPMPAKIRASFGNGGPLGRWIAFCNYAVFWWQPLRDFHGATRVGNANKISPKQ